VGVLGTVTAAEGQPVVGRMIDALRDRGWTEGRNIAYELRWAEGKSERYPEMVAEFLRLRVDLILAPSEDGALAAKRATQTVPIVTVYPLDPVRIGLIKSHARPGGNVTGLTYEAGSATTLAKTLDLLKEAVPGLSRVVVLWNPTSEAAGRWLKDIERAARELQLQIAPIAAAKPEDFGAAFAQMSAGKAEAMLITADPMYFVHRARLSELAVKYRLPSISPLHAFPDAGGLMGYLVDVLDLWTRAAGYVDKILKGANPAELPVEQPTKLLLVINLKTAKALGLRIPQTLLLRADRVIE
jgi:putative ABC transport system substrate-binding protein